MNLFGIVTRLESIYDLTGKVEVGLPPQTDSLSLGPRCWISDISETAAPSGRVNTPSIQRVTCTVGIIITGSGITEILNLRDSVRLALIDFQPDSPGDPMSYKSGRMEFLDAGITVWRDEFSFTYNVDLLEAA